jgi:hypothetical protein
MTFMTCANCSWDINLPDDGHLPPWCPHCGIDFKVASGEQCKQAMEALASPALLERAPVAPLRRTARAPSASPPSEAFTPAGAPVCPAPGTMLPPAPLLDAEPEPQPEPAPAPVDRQPLSPAELAAAEFPQPAPGWGQFNLGALGLAALLLVGCLVLTNSSVDKLTTSTKVQGKVVRMMVGRKGATFPVVAYWVAGKSYEVRSSSSGTGYQVGDTVEVLVPQGQPDQGTVHHFNNLWLGPLLTGVLGAGCLFIGLVGRRR